MYKNEMSKEEWTPTYNCDCVPDHDCDLKEKPFDVENMVGMHCKFNDLNCSLGKLVSDLQGILFICASREDVEKIKLSAPPAMPNEICFASIAENLLHLEAMVEDAKLLTDRIAAELGVDV